MKSLKMRYIAPRKMEFYEEKIGDPEPHEVQVEKRACGLCAADLFFFAHGPQPYGNWPGHEGIGIVTKVGKEVYDYEPGDVVYGGGFASVENLPVHTIGKIPYPVSDFSHWLVEPVACVVNGMDQAALRVGEKVALIGCGFMGLMLAQLIGRTQTVESLALDLNPSRLELARGFGMQRAYNPSGPDGAYLSQMNDTLDVVIDSTGAQKGLILASSLLRIGGRLVLFGWNHGNTPFPGDAWHLKGLTVINAAPGSAPNLKSCFDRAVRLIGEHRIDLQPLVTGVRPYRELPELLEAGVEHSHGYIKGVVTYEPQTA